MACIVTRGIAASLLVAAGVSLAGHQSPSTSSAPPPIYLNPDLPAEQRAKDLVSRMTLAQKVRQMQNNAPAIPELNVPAYDWWNEALHGVARAGQATVFPQAIGLAATWDTDLMFRVADIISTEARAKHHQALRENVHGRYGGLTFWSPNINIFRDPRWGRGQETYGEDPFLTGKLAVAFIKGMQGSDPKYFKVIATAKHFAVHSGPESSRHSFDVEPSQRDLRETYLPAFRMAITEGHAYSVMCAYNRVDGVPACASTTLLQDTLRRDWKFDGYVVSDCGAIADIYRGHQFKPDAASASSAAVWAGTDLTCGNEFVSLAGAVRTGLIDEADLDLALVRLFVARFRLGMFDPPERVPYASIPISVNDSEAHRAAALAAARASIVLLKNDRQTLPLKTSVKSMAVIGPSADDPVAPLGNYNGFSKKLVTPLEGVRTALTDRVDVRFAQGASYVPNAPSIVAVDALSPPGGSGHGLLAEYFDNPDLQGTPGLTRVEPRPVSPDVRDHALDGARIPAQGHSVRWTGTLTPPVSGEFAFSVQGNSAGTRVFIGDDQTTRKFLQAGQRYAFRVEYRPVTARTGQPVNNPMQLQWLPPAAPLLAKAIDVVRKSDLTVAFVGLNPRLEGEEMSVDARGFKGGDRTNLDLPEPQQRLVDAAIATGKPVVVVLTSGSAVAINTAERRAAAVLAAWYGGEEIGTAIAETLTGANNPAGRLPVTFYRDVRQLPAFDNYSMLGRTYRFFKPQPLFGFGFGLSYSTFEYSALEVHRTPDGAAITARVQNTSTRPGDEVVQLYVRGAGRSGDPIRELKGFRRVHLAAGESRSVQFTLTADDLAGRTGPVHISVGGGQPVGATSRVEGSIR
jgi:beta-glucosidase